jgi:hypothetical protein
MKGIVIGAIISVILISGCAQQNGMFGPLSGFLFQVDGHYYLVQGNEAIYEEQEIKRLTGLDDLYPPAINPTISEEEALNYANGNFNEYINDAEEELENFDPQQCVADCESSGMVMADRTCEEYCDTDYRASLQSRYDEAVGAELKEPVLVYDEHGAARNWRVFVRGENRIIVYYDVNAETGLGMGGGGNVNWIPEESEAKWALEEYLAGKGIVYVEISRGRYVYYPKTVPK